MDASTAPHHCGVPQADGGPGYADHRDREKKSWKNRQNGVHGARPMVNERPDDAPGCRHAGDHQRGRHHAAIQRLVNLRGVPMLPRLTDGAKEPCLQLGWKQCLRDPVDRVGDERTGVKEESKELRENRQRTAEHVEYRAPGVVCAVKEATDALQPGDRIPPIARDDHHVLWVFGSVAVETSPRAWRARGLQRMPSVSPRCWRCRSMHRSVLDEHASSTMGG